MEQVELDVALEELETRLERLRALYEQYFMGIERIEPAIARKDVDRRIYVLRREKIRNTAKRFKLQTIIQRYNTFQQYWQRICREIENGTYKRHLMKAEKNGQLLTIAARKRLGKAGRASQPPTASQSQPPAPASAPPSTPPVVPREAPAPAPLLTAAVGPAPARPLGSPPLPPRRPPLPGARPAPEAAAPAAVTAAVAPVTPMTTTAAKPAASAKVAPAKFESLDLDMDFMGDWDPAAAGRRPSPPAKPSPAAVPAAKASAPLPAAARAAAPLPVEPVPPPVTPAVAKPAPVAPPKAVMAPPKPAPLAAPPPITGSGSIPPRPVAVPPRPTSSSAPRAPTRPLTPRIPPAPRLPAAPPVARPAPPIVAPMPPATTAVAPKPAAAPAAASSFDDQRLRDLHARLQQAKQQTKEANVSYEGLARSIRATEAKLREQHQNRKIDFDVVIKDGKAVVKPIVR